MYGEYHNSETFKTSSEKRQGGNESPSSLDVAQRRTYVAHSEDLTHYSVVIVLIQQAC